MNTAEKLMLTAEMFIKAYIVGRSEARQIVEELKRLCDEYLGEVGKK